MKQMLKRVTPNALYRGLRFARRTPSLARASFYDFARYASNSSVINYDDDEGKLQAIITATYHNIEKGLSLPSPRLGFGKENLAKLVGYIDEALRRFGPRDYLTVPISVIEAYVCYHEDHGHDVAALKNISARLREANAPAFAADWGCGGVVETSRDEIVEATRVVAPDFFDKRFSCRQFSSEPVTVEQIQLAVRVAQKSPAVCNRQSGKVHAFLNQADIREILALQGGARGFSDGVRALLCVTADLRNFHGVGERYQGWIDGGLFAMSLIYGLHMQAIGSCCLNWSKNGAQDKKMRALIGLPPHETIIMFVAAGHLPARMEVARSTRKPLGDALAIRTLEPARQC